MKRSVVIMIVVITILLSATVRAQDVAGLYPKVGIVTEVWEEDGNNVIEVMDFDGYTWEFTNNDEIWYSTEVAALLMFDNGTAEIEDDMILLPISCGIPEDVFWNY